MFANSYKLLHYDLAFLIPESNGIGADVLYAIAAQRLSVLLFFNLIHSPFAGFVEFFFFADVFDLYDETDLAVLTLYDDVTSTFSCFTIAENSPVCAGIQ